MKALALLFVLALPLSAGELTTPKFEQAAVKLVELTEEDHGWWYLNERGGKLCVELVSRDEFERPVTVSLPCERDAITAVRQAIRYEEGAL